MTFGALGTLGRVGRLSRGFSSGGGGSYDYTNEEAAAFAAVAVQTNWDDTFRADLDQLYSDLKSGQVNGTNTLATLDMLYALDQPNSASSLRCLIDPTRTATAVNSPTFVAGQGFTGDGVAAEIDTNYNVSTDATNYTQNSAVIGAWIRQRGSSVLQWYFGHNGGSDTAIYELSAFDFRVAGPNDGFYSIASPSAPAFVCANRSGASALESYTNGVAGVTSITASSAPSNVTLKVLSEGGSRFSDGQVSVVVAGGSFTANKLADLHDALNRYRTAREAA